MRLREKYDVICAGGGLSSYLCAALLARTGKRVLVVEDADCAAPRTYGAGYVFDPDFVVFAELSESAAFARTMKELGIGHDLFIDSEAELQVLTPGYRINFSWNEETMRRSVRREIKSNVQQICDFFGIVGRAADEVPSFVEGVLARGQETSVESLSWKRFWGPYYPIIQSERPVGLGRMLHEGVAAQCENIGSAILGATTFAEPLNLGCEQSLRGLPLALRRQKYCIGGQEAMKRRLADIVVAAGGAVKRHTRVESLISESTKVVGVLLSSFEGIIRADTVVLGGQLRRLYNTLPEVVRDPTLVRALNRVVPASWRFTISVTVNRDVIPLGASELMTYVGSSQLPLQEENYLRIRILPEALGRGASAASASDDSRDTATLLVTTLVPYKASTLDYSYLRRIGGKILHVLADLMPFLEHNIVALYPDFRVSDQELREAYPFSGYDWVPENLMQYYVRGHRGAQDFWGPSWTTPHKGLYLAGRSIWPSLGVYGEALAARRIYDDVMLPSG